MAESRPISMRILHVVHQYPPDHVGGTEVYTQALARRQAAAGHRVAVFCPEGRGGDLGPTIENGVRVYRAGSGQRGRAAVFLGSLGFGDSSAAFEGVLTAEQPNIVHLQHLMGLPLSLVDSLNPMGVPYVITLHDYWYGCANAQLLTNYNETVCGGPDEHFVNCGRCALARAGAGRLDRLAPAVAPLMARRYRLLRQIFDGATAVVASTPFVSRAYVGMGFSAEHIRILPLGIDASVEEIAEARAARRRRGESGPLHIGYVGGLSQQKGVDHLIAAVNRLPAVVTLSIYGDPAAFPNYAAELRAAARHPGIRFEGLISRSALWPALGQLDVLVIPTLWYETYSIVAHEAYAAGVPVIASRIGVMPDVVREGIDGFLFPPGDVEALHKILLGLMEHPERVEALRAGLQSVRTMADHAEQVERVYAEVLAAGSPTVRQRG